MADYLRNSLPQTGATAYLVDTASGVVLADGSRAATSAAPLSVQAPALAAAAASAAEGRFTTSTGAWYFVQRDVANSPRRVVMSVPENTLYASLDGAARWAPWAMFGALTLVTLLFGRMLHRLQRNRLALRIANADLALLARVDKLTGLYNRRHIEDELAAHLNTAERSGSPLSVLMVDVDHFKLINDTHGHDVGDRALQSLAEAIRGSVRLGDVLGRWGGEEFVVLLPRTDVRAAAVVAERLREAAMNTSLSGRDGSRLRLTISVGVAASGSDDSGHSLMARADAALYRAKQAGRNAIAA